jgi:hypothetical protein
MYKAQIPAVQIQNELCKRREKFLKMKSFNFDLGKAIEAQAKSPLGYRSEFKNRELSSHFWGTTLSGPAQRKL